VPGFDRFHPVAKPAGSLAGGSIEQRARLSFANDRSITFAQEQSQAIVRRQMFG
jgi:hypothetical protein